MLFGFAWSLRGWVQLEIGGRRCRRPLLTALAAALADAEIVVGMLMEVFRCDAVAGDRRFPGENHVPLEYLIGAAANFEGGPVAVQGLISLRCCLSLLKGPLTAKAPRRALI
jgi:hypothetical protein